MRRFPPWVIWGAATITLWGAWVFLILGPQQRRNRQAHAELASVDQQRHAITASFSSTPELVAHVDSATARLHRIVARFHRVDSLDRLVDQLAALARTTGVTRVDVDPELACMMSLPSRYRPSDTMGMALDTLRLELSATGGFAAIGAWLDRLEARPDFQQWSGCEWAKGETEGNVNFNGRAAFWIIVPTEQRHE